LGRVLIVTSPVSASLQKVARDIAKVFNEQRDKLGITKAEVSLSRVVKPSSYQDVDLTIVVMVMDPVNIRGYAFIVWYQRQYGKNALLYTTVEGKPIISSADVWIIRDLSAIANSEYTAEKLKEVNMKVDGIIYHGVDVDLIQKYADARPVVRDTLGLNEEDFVVGYIAGCYKRKGHDKFAEVIQHVVRRDPSVKFVVVTQPSCAQIYSNLQNVVVVPRFGTMSEEEIMQYYHVFDLYAQASLAEGFGLPVLEALASGLPVVHVGYKPLSEITDKDTSFRVPVRAINYIQEYGAIKYELHIYHPKDFAEAILQAKEAILSDREGYRKKAIARAREFDIRKVYSRFIEIYKHGGV